MTKLKVVTGSDPGLSPLNPLALMARPYGHAYRSSRSMTWQAGRCWRTLVRLSIPPSYALIRFGPMVP